jgi:hypothetical protein
VRSNKSAVYTAPAVSKIVVQFDNNGALPAYCVVENLDAANGVTLKYQESDDGTTWSDIAGTNASVAPGASDGQKVTSVRRYIALFAGGNALMEFSVQRQINGSPANLGVA